MNANKSKVMVLREKEGLVSEFIAKYLGFCETDQIHMEQNIEGEQEWKESYGCDQSLGNPKGFQCEMVL